MRVEERLFRVGLFSDGRRGDGVRGDGQETSDSAGFFHGRAHGPGRRYRQRGRGKPFQHVAGFISIR